MFSLYGITLVQTYIYYDNSEKDKWTTKSLVRLNSTRWANW